LRERVSGTISGNTIANNGEGGIEVVVGKSNVLINNNEIKKNKASGIAAQFYSQASKIGKIEIKKNYISYNGAYGLVCKAPSGGNPSEGYYNESIELTENKIQNNKSKAISKTCDIVKAVSEEEKKSNEAIESEDSEELPSETIIKTEAEVAQEKFILKEDQLRTVATEIRTNYQASSEVFSEISNSISERGALVKFFIGNDRKKLKIFP
jgi:parallel beta-helix repeat protein